MVRLEGRKDVALNLQWQVQTSLRVRPQAERKSRPGISGVAVVRLEGFEPPTNGFGSHYSIRLSYRRPGKRARQCTARIGILAANASRRADPAATAAADRHHPGSHPGLRRGGPIRDNARDRRPLRRAPPDCPR